MEERDVMVAGGGSAGQFIIANATSVFDLSLGWRI